MLLTGEFFLNHGHTVSIAAHLYIAIVGNRSKVVNTATHFLFQASFIEKFQGPF